MAKQSPRRQASKGVDQDARDRELDAWMDRALGARKSEPQPIVRDL